MSILIKGMEMPKNCAECLNVGWHYVFECNLDDVDSGERRTDCPLVPVPPHGRLGDLDELHKEYIEKPKQTNYDRIVSKSPGELAEWLAEVLFHCSNTICDQRCPMYECCCDQPSDNIEDWLIHETEEGE